VTGRVQGVYFRASTAELARRLGMDGRALNLPDGSVEVLASGSEAAHRELETWLRAGPPAARVDKVSVEAHTGPVPAGFSTG
jgi:acylphosphatase